MEAPKGRITIPFTYRIICPDGRYYYGVRYAKGCSPDDLWTTYFTSSKVIKELLKTTDPKDFKYEIRKIFQLAEDALIYERRVLKRIVGKDNCINQHIGDKKFHNKKPHTEETKEKIRQANIGKKQSIETKEKKNNSNTGKKRSKETIEKIRVSNIGKNKGKVAWNKGIPHSEETKQKLSDSSRWKKQE